MPGASLGPEVKDHDASVKKLESSGGVNAMYAPPSRNIYTIKEESRKDGESSTTTTPTTQSPPLSEGTNLQDRSSLIRYQRHRMMGRPRAQYGGESSRRRGEPSQEGIELREMRRPTPQTGGDAHRDERDDPIGAWIQVVDNLHEDSADADAGEDENYAKSEDDIPGWMGVLAACFCCCFCKRQNPCD